VKNKSFKSSKQEKKGKKVKTNKIFFFIGFIISAFLFTEVAAHADETDQSTKITFNQPVEIPGHVLPAGTYLFKLADPNNLDIVQIFNADQSHLYATVSTVATDQREAADDTVVVLAHQKGADNPEALVKWFYPGRTTGHEFVYPKQEEQELAQARLQMIVAKGAAEAGD
jgi:Protein of unknown function (DUF2911)